MRRLLWLGIVVVGISAVVLLVWQRGRARADIGPAVAYCPGPDSYGYTCENGRVYSYIDATNPLGLITLDGFTTIDLPFPFTFYATTYTQIQVVSNGNLQFDNGNVDYNNQCLDDGPASTMGDMIAPYWTDTDLRFDGSIDTEVIGEAPDRIFVVEWDAVPLFEGDESDRLSFEVQLFEGSNDIVFVYANTSTLVAPNGQQATVGMQSAEQGVALQFSCNQPSVQSGSSLAIVHPEQPNPDLGRDTATSTALVSTTEMAPRAATQQLLDQLALHGTAALPALQTNWLQQPQARQLRWQHANLLSDDQPDLVAVWSAAGDPAVAEVVIVDLGRDEAPILIANDFLASAELPLGAIAIVEVADLTGDGLDEVLLVDSAEGQRFVLSSHGEAYQRHTLPGRCALTPTLADLNADGQLDILAPPCRPLTWDGATFAPLP